jgi:hypothetical protein
VITNSNPVDEGTGPEHIPGAWPVAPSFDSTTPAAPDFLPGGDAWQALQAERAERHIILGRIRAHLEAEPNARAIIASGKRWSSYITVLARDIAAEREAS